MDSFDDLLAPSRRALEDNPFEDPFAQPRSSSPDPWASYSHHLGDNPFHEEQPTRLHSESENTSEDVSSPDPLESATVNGTESESSTSESLPRTPTLTSPGFRESAPSPETQSHPVLEPEPEPEPLPESAPVSPAQPVTDHQPEPQPPSPIPKNSALPTHSSPPSSTFGKLDGVLVSPLDQQSSGSGFENSFASLALGAEALGGWQSATQSTFINGTNVSISNEPSLDDDDDEDNRPVLQSPRLKAREQVTNSTFPSASTNKNKEMQPVFSITVDDPQRVGDPIRAYTMYTVHTRTTSPMFSKSAFSVLRRYSDFLWLYETLSMNNPGVVVPPVPEKNPFGRFDDQFVRQRRVALERCIQKTANHPVLQNDTDLKLFLESDTFALDIRHRKAEIAHERGGLMASIGQTIAGPRFYEMDEWFDRQKTYLDSLESQLRGLVKAVDVVIKHRTEMAVATGEFAQTISDLASSDLGKQLSHSLSGLGDVEAKAQEWQQTQNEQDMVTIMSTADEYARLINSVRLAFSSRIRTYHSWQNADQDAKRAKQVHERSRVQGRTNNQSLSAIVEMERRALDAKQDFDKASRLVKTEVARFEQERIEDFRDTLQAFLSGMIDRQKQLITAWESYQQVLLKKVVPQTLPPQKPEVEQDVT